MMCFTVLWVDTAGVAETMVCTTEQPGQDVVLNALATRFGATFSREPTTELGRIYMQPDRQVFRVVARVVPGWIVNGVQAHAERLGSTAVMRTPPACIHADARVGIHAGHHATMHVCVHDPAPSQDVYQHPVHAYANVVRELKLELQKRVPIKIE